MSDEIEVDAVAALRARLIQAELRTEAVRAGMVDLDGVKLVDLSTVVLGETGIEDGAALMARLREEKPWLFGRASSSSSGRAPVVTPPKMRTAMEMNEAEWRAARAEIIRRK